jgi:hypothetical protein
MRSKLLFAHLLCLLLSAFCYAQTSEITGTIRDENGVAVAGAVITVKGSKITTVTNDNGYYSIKAASGATLIVSYVGYANRELVVNGHTLDIAMTKHSRDLDEVVVTALGIKKDKKAVSYAITEVKGSELTEARTVDIANSLEGKVAGPAPIMAWKVGQIGAGPDTLY